jgi:hypothetical protein
MDNPLPYILRGQHYAGLFSYYQPQFSKRVAEVVPVWAAAPVWVAVLVEVLAPAVVPVVLARPLALTLFLLMKGCGRSPFPMYGQSETGAPALAQHAV